ncbi:MAG TPA: hypothetical protein VHJ76_03355, partial [Actinomycetota bacterium]|nr:hypothetical protein [Actinomycetota bacterium]
MGRLDVLRRSGAVWGVILVASLLGPPAPAREVAERVTLTRVVTITGDSPGRLPVRLPRDAVVDVSYRPSRPAGPNRDIDIRGSGRFAGFAMVEDPYPGGPRSGRFLLAGRFHECAESCGSRGWNVLAGTEDGTLEAGDYVLYLISDGSPGTITVRFRSGLPSGETRLEPAEGSERVDVKELTTRLFNASKVPTVWTGSHFQGGQVGLSLSFLVVRAQTEIDEVSFGACTYDHPGPPPEEVAYGPHCSAFSGTLGAGFLGPMMEVADRTFVLMFGHT